MTDKVSAQPAMDAESLGDTGADNEVIVGIDGSSGSMKAIRWAVARADRFGSVRPVATWRYPAWAHAMPIPPPVDQYRDVAVKAVEDVKNFFGNKSLLCPLVCRADPGRTLVEVGDTANLIVVGTRGRSGLHDTLLGSVSSYVVAHATVPVAVVPARAAVEDVHQRVVVGIDGSANSLSALIWALTHTSPATTVDAVHCWNYPVSATPGLAMISRNEFENRARLELDEVIAAATDEVGTPSHRIERRVEYGDPQSILHQHAEAADLLVVGSRGRGRLSHLLLGSVTTALIHRPTVPTVVVPAV